MTKPIWTAAGIEARFREYLGDDADDSREARKRRRILAAAYELFLQQGYRKTSVDDVAARAQVAKGTVYLYFRSKADMLVHSIALEKKVLLARITHMLSPATPERERLRAWIELALIAARDMPLSARLLTGDAELLAALDEIDDAEVARGRTEGREFGMTLIELAAPGALDDDEKARRADALSTLGFFGGMLLDERVRGGRPLEEVVSTLADMLARGAIARPTKVKAKARSRAAAPRKRRRP